MKPTTEPELAALHELLSTRLSRLTDEKIALGNQISEVCQARILLKYGVKTGSTVECLERQKTGTVVSFSAYRHCEHPPYLNVKLEGDVSPYGSTVTNWKLITT